MDIPRILFPQIVDTDDFVTWLRDQGIIVSRLLLNPKYLLIAQDEINPDKVAKLREKELQKPIITSKDNYILDGNHRAVAAKENKQQIPTFMVNLNFSELLPLARKYPKAFFKESVGSLGNGNVGGNDYYFGGVADYPSDKNGGVDQPDPPKRVIKKEGSYLGLGTGSYYQVTKDNMEEEEINTAITKKAKKMSKLKKIAEKYHIEESVLDQVYDRGIAEWNPLSEHALPEISGFARVALFIEGKIDTDLAVREKFTVRIEKNGVVKEVTPVQWVVFKKQGWHKVNVAKEELDSGLHQGGGVNTPYYGSYDKEKPINVKEEVNRLFESQLLGTDAAAHNYRAATPGQEGYGTKVDYHTEYQIKTATEEHDGPDADDLWDTAQHHHNEMGKAGGDKIMATYHRQMRDKYASMARKATPIRSVKDAPSIKEDYAGADYNSRLFGAATAAGGIGGAYSALATEEKPKGKDFSKIKDALKNKYNKIDEDAPAPEDAADGGDDENPPETGYSKQTNKKDVGDDSISETKKKGRK